ncbi:hypothetical protein H5410_056178 [Solanum commersonii]|uniref:Uncharacterized protein n=1 Tax=Solanum commersonii TaxID=4109 RepID=A0A9J5WLI1_SOLCO|nr:hypothetical protein H5410_056178 [Solanum commersonii]
MEKDARLKEDASINAQLHDLRKALKSLQITRGAKSLEYDDLCIHPDIDMSVGCKPPKFDMFDEKGDPHAHLRAYCDKLVKLVKIGDSIGEGVKSGKIQSMVALQATSRAIQSGSIVGIKKKKGRMFQLSLTNNDDRPTDTPVIPKSLRILHASYVPVQAPINQNRLAYAPRPRPNLEARNACTYTPITEPYAQLLERLRTAGVLQPVEGKLSDPIPHCYKLKNQIESLMKRGVIKCTPAPPNVNNNPLPNHENRKVNMVTLDEEYGGP